MRKYFNKRMLVTVLASVFVFLAAFGLVFLVQAMSGPGGAGGAINWILDGHKGMFIFTSLFVLTVTGAIAAFTKSPLLVVGITYAVGIIFGFVNGTKYNYRGMWLLPEDFGLIGEAGELAGMINYNSLIWTIVIAVLILVLSITGHFLIRRWSKNWLKNTPKWKPAVSWSLRSVAAVVGIVCCILMVATIFSTESQMRRQNNPWRENIWNMQIIKWNQLENYQKNGVIVGFVFNLAPRNLIKPEGYSEDALREISEKYAKIAEEGNKYRNDLAKEDVDIVFIMNESFYDPSILKDYYPYTGGDVTPNLHKLQKQMTSLSLYSNEYGGGTANVEFEALTGLTNYFYGALPYQDIVSKLRNFTSLASVLKPMGYDTYAVHPYNGTFYKRNIVYKNMGFDHFITEDDFQDKSGVAKSEYISDEVTYNKLFEILEAGGDKKFIHTVTMQNHLPYGSVFDTNQFESTAGYGNDYEISDYLSMLHESDRMLGELINRLENLDRRVILVFWGDHAPGIYGEMIGTEQNHLVHQTPMLIYKNYYDDVKEVEMPEMVTANQIPNLLFDALYAKKPAIFYLLDALMETYPVLARKYVWFDEIEWVQALGEYDMICYSYFSGAMSKE